MLGTARDSLCVKIRSTGQNYPRLCGWDTPEFVENQSQDLQFLTVSEITRYKTLKLYFQPIAGYLFNFFMVPWCAHN